MQVARLGLDFVSEQEHVVLLADDREALERGESPRLRLEIARDQALAVIRRIQEVVAAGRPRCPLCGQPLPGADSEHFCPRTNGHSEELSLPEGGGGDGARLARAGPPRPAAGAPATIRRWAPAAPCGASRRPQEIPRRRPAAGGRGSRRWHSIRGTAAARWWTAPTARPRART